MAPAFVPRVSNMDVLQRAGMKAASRMLEEQQLLQFGKVLRAQQTSPLHAAAMVPGTLQPATERFVRKVGRPRKEWVPTVIAHACTKTHPDSLYRIAKDQHDWKRTMLG